MATTLSQRLQKILEYSGLSVRGLAIKCGLKQPTLDKHIKGIAEPSAVTLMQILKNYPEISADWLLLGTGSMITPVNKESERVNLLLDTIATLQKSLNAKEDAIVALNERIAQLETQLKSK